MGKIYQGSWPTYKVFKVKGKYAVHKFKGFDHSWAEYSKPLATFDTESDANEYIGSLESTNDD